MLSFPDRRQSVSSLSGPLQVVPDIDDQVNHPEQEVNYIPALLRTVTEWPSFSGTDRQTENLHILTSNTTP